MNLNNFIEKLREEFEDEIESHLIQPNTKIKDLEDWGSMYALIVIAMVDIEYDVTITGVELSKCETPEDIFDLVCNKVTA